jgi:hypothetical protein
LGTPFGVLTLITLNFHADIMETNKNEIYRVTVKFREEKIHYVKNYYGLAANITNAITLAFVAAKKESCVDFSIEDASKIGEISFDENLEKMQETN